MQSTNFTAGYTLCNCVCDKYKNIPFRTTGAQRGASSDVNEKTIRRKLHIHPNESM